MHTVCCGAAALVILCCPFFYRGRIYFPTAVGKGFYVLQVLPKRAKSSQAQDSF